MQPWTKKYAPKKISEVYGQQEPIKEILGFVNTFPKHKKKAVLVHGAPGSGKTSAIHAIASQLDMEIVELNASDFRNREKINAILGNALKQQSLFMKPKLFLVDEVDGVAGRQDFGGIAAITSLISENRKYPVVMTANDASLDKIKPLKKLSMTVEFEPVPYADSVAALKSIAEKEGLDFEEEALQKIAILQAGDLRSAINDLQAIHGKVTSQAVESLGERERDDTITNALLKILKTTDIDVALHALDYVKEDLDEAILWLDHNTPQEYEKPKDIARAFDSLSKADVFRGRIRRWQHWRFLVYINALASAGVALAKDEKYRKMTKYERSKRILRMWIYKNKLAKRNSISEKLARKTHCSRRRAFQEIPFLKLGAKSNREFATMLEQELDLDKDEVDWLVK